MTVEILDGDTKFLPLSTRLLAGFLLLSLIPFLIVIYNLTLHPLRKYPGPKLWAATRIPHSLMVLRGQPHKEILALHQKYGEIVRISPNELSFQSSESWKEIMGHHKREENGKDPTFVKEERLEIVSSTREDHTRFRRILSHGFSAKNMLEQQPIIRSYVDLLIERLHGLSTSGRGPVDLVSWYNFTTFDIIGDLAFGESFGCLDESDYHPWVRLIFENIKMFVYLNVARSYSGLTPLLRLFVPKSLVEKSKAHTQLVRERVDKRMSLGAPRPDFAESMISNKGKEPLSKAEIYENSDTLIIAGSETTATALSGATYLLTSNPDKLAKLVQEIRSEFAHSDDIDLLNTAKLSYLNAVFEESLRMYPPVPSALPRVTPPGGQTILGEWVPGNTALAIWQWPMYHNERHFYKPFEFHPERWLGDPQFQNDNAEVLKPFSFGPRNCLGMNLAYAEMRLILAKVLWNFDLQLATESKDWLNQEVYTLWDKKPLMVHLTPRGGVQASQA